MNEHGGRCSREPARTFQDLTVWRKAHEFVIKIYEVSSTFPSHERYGVTSQLRRAAVSIPANIAEGFKKNGRSDKARFLNIAQGSLEEARYYLILTKDLRYADVSELLLAIDEVSRMLDAYSNALLSKRT